MIKLIAKTTSPLLSLMTSSNFLQKFIRFVCQIKTSATPQKKIAELLDSGKPLITEKVYMPVFSTYYGTPKLNLTFCWLYLSRKLRKSKQIHIFLVANHLREADVKIFSNLTCSEYSLFADKEMFCAGNSKGGFDTCEGDSGGPCTCDQSGKHDTRCMKLFCQCFSKWAQLM